MKETKARGGAAQVAVGLGLTAGLWSGVISLEYSGGTSGGGGVAWGAITEFTPAPVRRSGSFTIGGQGPGVTEGSLSIDMPLPQFDPALGQLVDVEVTLNPISLNSAGSLTNNSDEAFNFDAAHSESTTTTIPGLPPDNLTLVGDFLDATLGAGETIEGFGRPFLSLSIADTVTPDQFDPYIGTATVSVVIDHVTRIAIDGPDNDGVVYEGSLEATAEAVVTYLFDDTFAAPVDGDANSDGKVDATDLNVVAINWQQMVANGPASGDFNSDGKVDATDLNALALNWQFGVGEDDGSLVSFDEASAAALATIPEPTVASILAVVLAAFSGTTRRGARSRQ